MEMIEAALYFWSARLCGMRTDLVTDRSKYSNCTVIFIKKYLKENLSRYTSIITVKHGEFLSGVNSMHNPDQTRKFY